MPDEPDYYETLQVSPRADAHVIDAAYKNLARKYHPDLNPSSDAHERMSELNRAIETLRDPRKREEYDRRRIRSLAQSATAARSPALLIGMVHQVRYSVLLRESLSHLSVGWLIFVGGLVVALVGMAMMARQLVGDSGGEQQTSAAEELLGLDDNSGSSRGDGLQPQASPSPPAQAGVPLAPTPTPTASPGPQAPTPQALSAVRNDAPPGGSPAAGPAATPTPAPVTVVTPAPAPVTPLPSTPPATTPAPPTPTPSPSCSAGPPHFSETGNQVDFTNGDVDSFQAGTPDVLVVDVAVTVLQVEITPATHVTGDLDSATIVSGNGRRAKDGTVAAQLVEVICP